MRMSKLIKSAESFQLTVNYEQTVEELKEACGYHRVHIDINSRHFKKRLEKQFRGINDIEVNLLWKNKLHPSRLLPRDLHEEGFRGATLWELMIFGTCFPLVQSQFSIAGLGSRWHMTRVIHQYPYLANERGGRCVLLRPGSSIWRRDTRFLAIKK